jgi:hypothetical protein
VDSIVYLGSDRPNDDKYLIKLFGKINSVKKNDMTPHQPAKKVISVYSQKYFFMQVLHKFPLIDLLLRMNIMPMFWCSSTYFVGASLKQFWQNDA